jgi:hypothetical protein
MIYEQLQGCFAALSMTGFQIFHTFCAFPGGSEPFRFLHLGWKAQPSSPGGGGYLGLPSVGKAQPFRTASGGAAHHSPSTAA